jgi:hypothetical protein
MAGIGRHQRDVVWRWVSYRQADRAGHDNAPVPATSVDEVCTVHPRNPFVLRRSGAAFRRVVNQFFSRPNRSPYQLTATVRAKMLKMLLCAVSAKGAFE